MKRIVPLAWAFLLAACATTPVRSPEPPERTLQLPLFQLVETRESGDKVAYPRVLVASDVDVNSAVEVRLARDVVAELLRERRLDGGADEEAMAALEALLQRYASAVVVYREGTEALARALEAEGPVPAETLRKVTEAYQGFSQLMLDVKRFIFGRRGEEAGLALWNELGRRLEIKGRPDAFVDAALRAEREAIREALERRAARLPCMELFAQNLTTGAQIHLPGYDDVAEEWVGRVDKLKPVFDEDFEKEYAAAQKVVEAARDVDGLKEAALQAVADRVQELEDALRELGDTAFGDLEGALAGLKGVWSGEAARALKAFEKDVSSAKKECGQVVTKGQEALDIFQGRRSLDPAAALQALTTTLGGLVNDAGVCVNALQTAKASGAALAEEVGTLGAAAAARLEKAVGSLWKKLLGAGAELLATVGNGIAGGVVGPVVTKPLPLSEARDTRFRLTRTKRSEGDTIAVVARVYVDGAVFAEWSQDLVVRSDGWVADTGAGILAIYHFDDKERGSSLPLAPSAHLVFRYQGRRDADETRDVAGWLFAPAAGIGAVAVPTGSGGTTLGWTLNLQIFGDILQFHGGVTVTKKWFLGLGVGLHRFLGFGAQFGL